MSGRRIVRQRRWRLLRSGFSNWRLPALLAFVDYRTSRIRPGVLAPLSRMRCSLRTRSGTRMVARVQDLNAPAEVFGRDEYAVEDLDLPAVEFALDLGGHVGSFTLWTAERSGARFLVVEPNPSVFELLAENVRPLGDRVRLVQAAVAAEPGTGWLGLDRDSPSSRMRPGGCADGLRVRTITLADAMIESGFPRFDLVKMDVEGSEYTVLGAAGRDVLRSGRRWIVECHPGHDGDAAGVQALFETAGFETHVARKPDGLALVTAARRD